MAIIYNGVNVAQDPLVSGTNIKTVNGTSLLGSGNIVAGASTDYLAIGTYVFASEMNLTGNATLNAGVTVAGSALYRYVSQSQFGGKLANSGFEVTNTGKESVGASGTWRRMNFTLNPPYPTGGYIVLYLRVS